MRSRINMVMGCSHRCFSLPTLRNMGTARDWAWLMEMPPSYNRLDPTTLRKMNLKTTTHHNRLEVLLLLRRQDWCRQSMLSFTLDERKPAAVKTQDSRRAQTCSQDWCRQDLVQTYLKSSKHALITTESKDQERINLSHKTLFYFNALWLIVVSWRWLLCILPLSQRIVV
jgi:hypothetical protein